MGLDLHDLLHDNEKYIYRNDAFFYIPGNSPNRLKMFYEQINKGSLSTEARIIEVPGLQGNVTPQIKVTYIKWSLDNEI